MANTLLIWEKTPFVAKIASQLAIFDDRDIIQFSKEFHQVSVNTKDCIFLLLETTINGKERQELGGIDLIRQLRKENKFRGPIFVFTTYPLSFIKSKKEAQILYSSGVFLYPLTYESLSWDDLEPVVNGFPRLSDMLLEDIIHSVFDASDRIHELLHNMKNELNSSHLDANRVVVTSHVAGVFNKYEPLVKREIETYHVKTFEKLFSALKQRILEDFEELIKNNKEDKQVSYLNAGASVSFFTNQILELALVGEKYEASKDKQDVAWEAIFLDDNPNIREIVKEYFSAKDIVCHTASTKDEVADFLRIHGSKISLFLCDIRLLHDDGNWHDQQGYDVIDDLANNNSFPITYTVLTSKKGAITRMIRQKRPYQVLWFSKDDVIDSKQSFNIFFDIVARSAEDMHLSNNRFQPTLKRWHENYPGHYRFPLKDYYKRHRESIDYPVEEPLLNRQALAFLEGHLEKDRWEWQGKLNKKFIDDQVIAKFRHTKLLGRRIVLAYVASGLITKGEHIYRRMMNAEDERISESTVRQFFMKLALPSEPAILVDQAKKYAIDNQTPPAILREEYDFLLIEYIVEQIENNLKLNTEAENFLTLLQHLKRVMESKNIEQPPIFKKVLGLVKKHHEPKAERLDQMFGELEGLIGTHGSSLFTVEGIPKIITTFKNEFLCEMFKKYDWI